MGGAVPLLRHTCDWRRRRKDERAWPQAVCPRREARPVSPDSRGCHLQPTPRPRGPPHLPYGHRSEEEHGGDVVQEGGQDGGDETEHEDHGPHSSPGQSVGLGHAAHVGRADRTVVRVSENQGLKGTLRSGSKLRPTDSQTCLGCDLGAYLSLGDLEILLVPRYGEEEASYLCRRYKMVKKSCQNS